MRERVRASSNLAIVGDGFPDWGIPASIGAIAPLMLALLLIVFSVRGGASGWSPRQQLALAAGALSFWIILSPIQELAAGAIGMTLVGAATAYSRRRFERRLMRTERPLTRQLATGRTRPVTLPGDRP